jgi:hypothetical protein
MTDNVGDYAHGIVRDLEALEELAAHRWDGWGPDELEELEELNLSPAARELLAELTDGGALADNDGDPIGAWLDYTLGITVHGTCTLGESDWTVRAVEVLRTTGGPHATVTVDGGPYATVRVIWGSAATEREAIAPTLSETLLELAESYGV